MHNKYNILVVEDELELAKSTFNFLSENGFQPFHAKNLKEAGLLLKSESFSAVLLDLGLPDGDGMSIIVDIKSNNNDIGLIVVSARDALSKKVQALELGADDYLTKPFFLPELNARLKAVIRRLNLGANNEVVLNEISLFPEQMRVVVNDNDVDLTAKEWEMVLC